jgi:Xaa-Pro aminopeptidase
VTATAPSTPELDFSRAEYEQRVTRVRDELRRRGADLLLVDQLDHVAWLFGYLPTAARYQACILPVDGEPHMVVRELDLPTFLTSSWVASYEAYPDSEDPLDRVAAAIGVRTDGRPAVEKDSNLLTARRMERLAAALPGVRWVDGAELLWEQRLIKSAAEIAYLERAGKIADACVTAGVEAVAEGADERDPAIATYAAGLRLGADNGRVALFGYGATVGNMHGRLGQRRLERGETYFIEAVPQVRGYSARTVRPISIGTPSPERGRLAERLVAIQDAQIAALEPGAVAADVDALCRDAVLREGLKREFPQLTGYTLGYHAQPRTSDHTRIFAPGQEWTVEADMVFHMMLFADGLPFSETVHVTADGPRRLTRLDRALVVR